MKRFSIPLLLLLAACAHAQSGLQYLDFGPTGKATAAVTDTSGNLYVVGYVGNIPASPDQPRAYKVTPSGVVVYSYSLPGGTFGVPTSAAVDSSGGLFFAGFSYCDSASGTQPLHPLTSATIGTECGFIAKLDPTGKLLLYSTLGAVQVSASNPNQYESGSTAIAGIAVDAKGAVYVTGATNSYSFPTTPNAFQKTGPYSLLPTYQAVCGFIAKIPATIDGLEYSTFLCGSSGGSSSLRADTPEAIAVDAHGQATVAGGVGTLNFPTTTGAFNNPRGRFVTRLSADGSSLVWSALLSGDDFRAIALDSSGNAVLAGITSESSDYSVTPGGLPASSPASRLNSWPFLTKLSSDGTTLLATTFLAGSISENINALSLDSQGNVWVLGTTESPDFPSLPSSLQLGNTFVAEIAPGLNGILQVDRLPSINPTPIAGPIYIKTYTYAGALPLDPSGAPILVGDSGAVLHLPRGFESRPGILGTANTAATYAWPYVSPGSFVSLYGIALGPASAEGTAYDLPGHLATTLGGVSVTFDGTPATLLYAGPSQVNAIVPFAVAGQSSTVMRIQNAAGLSQTLTLSALDATPYTFNYLPAQWVDNPTNGALPFPMAAALNQDGTINSVSNPAQPGDIITIFANGAGVLNPPLADGMIQPFGPSLPTLPVQVCFSLYTSASVCSTPLYAGSAPQQVAGVLQVNFRLPGSGLSNELVLVVGEYQIEAVGIYEVQK